MTQYYLSNSLSFLSVIPCFITAQEVSDVTVDSGGTKKEKNRTKYADLKLNRLIVAMDYLIRLKNKKTRQ